MASTEEVLKALQNAKITTLAATEPEELVIDAETRTITVPSSERLFGVTGDMNIERKYFRCPKIVGDNVDLSTHQIFIAYVYTETESGSIFPSIGVAPYHCEDVEVDGEDITFSWKLTGNVFKNPGFILFKMYAKRTETDPNTVFNTTPAIGTVLATIRMEQKRLSRNTRMLLHRSLTVWMLWNLSVVVELAAQRIMKNFPINRS